MGNLWGSSEPDRNTQAGLRQENQQLRKENDQLKKQNAILVRENNALKYKNGQLADMGAREAPQISYEATWNEL